MKGRRLLGDAVLRPPPPGAVGYPEGKKTERSEGPESLRYIARSQATVRAVRIGGVRSALDAHPSMTQGCRTAPAGFSAILRDAVLLRFADTFFSLLRR